MLLNFDNLLVNELEHINQTLEDENRRLLYEKNHIQLSYDKKIQDLDSNYKNQIKSMSNKLAEQFEQEKKHLEEMYEKKMIQFSIDWQSKYEKREIELQQSLEKEKLANEALKHSNQLLKQEREDMKTRYETHIQNQQNVFEQQFKNKEWKFTSYIDGLINRYSKRNDLINEEFQELIKNNQEFEERMMEFQKQHTHKSIENETVKQECQDHVSNKYNEFRKEIRGYLTRIEELEEELKEKNVMIQKLNRRKRR